MLAAIAIALDDRESIRRMVLQAKEFADGQFGLKRLVDDVAVLYSSVVPNQGYDALSRESNRRV